MYDNGQGVPQDYKQAFDWYRKAAAQGHADAQAKLGWLYSNGHGVPQDHKQAVNWFRKAADQGSPHAQFLLGLMYDEGQGVPQDYKQALEWYRKAAAQGNPDAQANLGWMYKHGHGVRQDYKQAVIWYRKAAEQGDLNAQFLLGLMYDNGQGVPQDYKQALDWYRKAAAQGHADAQTNLGVMYGKGTGVPKNYAKAIEWYRKSAEQGDPTAQSNLGYMYESGRGTPKDYIQAYAWYATAYARSNEKSDEKKLNNISRSMSPNMIAEAQRLASDYFVRYDPNAPKESATSRVKQPTEPGEQVSRAEQDASNTSSQAQDVYRTTPDELYNDYDANEVATDVKIAGRPVEVTGLIESIDKDFSNTIVINMPITNQYMPAMFHLRDSQTQAAIKLKKGQTVTLLCKDMMRLMNVPSGSYCTIE